MGLDTVALIVDTENYFGISLDPAEAIKIYTVQDFINLLYAKVQITPSDRCKSQLLFYRFREYFHHAMAIDKSRILPTSNLRSLLHGYDVLTVWHSIQNDLKLTLPALMPRDLNPALSENYEFFGMKVFGRSEPVTQGTIKGLIHWTLAINHKTFIDPRNICSKKDLENIFIGVLSESVGIPVHEIKLHHSFTDDLGLD